MTNQEIINTGQTIANETQIGGNTAERVGGVIEAIGENLNELSEEVNNIQPIEIYGDVTNAPDEEDLTSVNVGGTDVLKFKDKAYNPITYSGMGRKILRKNIVDGVNTLTQEMMSDTNTIYIIQYDYDLNGQTITMPAGCVLEFDGGSVKNGTIDGVDTSISTQIIGKIFSLDLNLSGTWNVQVFYPEWFGAYGDGVHDDTSVLQKLDGLNIQLLGKTYLVTNLVYSTGTRINGVGIEKSIIQQSENATGDCILIEGYRSAITNLTIKGVRHIEVLGDDVFRALLKVHGYGTGRESSYYFNLQNVEVIDTDYSGVVLVGSETGDPVIAGRNSWVFHIQNLFVKRCNCWCMIDETSDNTMSDVYLTYGGLGNLWCRSGSNMYCNFKLDGQGGYLGDPDSMTEGCLMLVSAPSNNLHFLNLDIQSGQYGGIKVLNSKKITIRGNINNCGVGYNADPTNRKGSFLYVNNSEFVDFDLTFFKINAETKYGVYLENNCTYCRGFLNNVNRMENVNLAPDTCKISDSFSNPYIDEETIDYTFPHFSSNGNPVSCFPVYKYRLNVVSVISAQETLRNLIVSVMDTTIVNASSINSDDTRIARITFPNTDLEYFKVSFTATVDYSGTTRLIQIIDNENHVVSPLSSVQIPPEAREFTVVLDGVHTIRKINIFVANNITNSTGHTISVSSASIQKILKSYSQDLGKDVTNAEFNWKTGELNENGTITKFTPINIYAVEGENVIEGNTSEIIVSGASSIISQSN